MIQSLMILVAGFISFTIANHLNKIKLAKIELQSEMDNHLIEINKSMAKERGNLIELYEEEIMRLESLNDNLLNELKYKDILGGS